MAIDDIDRRRFLYAAIVSLLALPALWWANRDTDSAAPQVATAGVEVSSGSNAASPVSVDEVIVVTTIGRSNLPPTETLGDNNPVFLDGPTPNVGEISQIAIPADSGDSIVTQASYRSSITSVNTCLAIDIPTGTTITVINLDNNRTVTCRVALAPANQTERLVLHTDRFSKLADLTDAPIPVEIRQ